MFPPLPRFQPEHFALLRSPQTDRYKQFLKGLTQIEEEGAIQLFYPVAQRQARADSGRGRCAAVRRRALPTESPNTTSKRIWSL